MAAAGVAENGQQRPVLVRLLYQLTAKILGPSPAVTSPAVKTNKNAQPEHHPINDNAVTPAAKPSARELEESQQVGMLQSGSHKKADRRNYLAQAKNLVSAMSSKAPVPPLRNPLGFSEPIVSMNLPSHISYSKKAVSFIGGAVANTQTVTPDIMRQDGHLLPESNSPHPLPQGYGNYHPQMHTPFDSVRSGQGQSINNYDGLQPNMQRFHQQLDSMPFHQSIDVHHNQQQYVDHNNSFHLQIPTPGRVSVPTYSSGHDHNKADTDTAEQLQDNYSFLIDSASELIGFDAEPARDDIHSSQKCIHPESTMTHQSFRDVVLSIEDETNLHINSNIFSDRSISRPTVTVPATSVSLSASVPTTSVTIGTKKKGGKKEKDQTSPKGSASTGRKRKGTAAAVGTATANKKATGIQSKRGIQQAPLQQSYDVQADDYFDCSENVGSLLGFLDTPSLMDGESFLGADMAANNKKPVSDSKSLSAKVDSEVILPGTELKPQDPLIITSSATTLGFGNCLSDTNFLVAGMGHSLMLPLCPNISEVTDRTPATDGIQITSGDKCTAVQSSSHDSGGRQTGTASAAVSPRSSLRIFDYIEATAKVSSNGDLAGNSNNSSSSSSSSNSNNNSSSNSRDGFPSITNGNPVTLASSEIQPPQPEPMVAISIQDRASNLSKPSHTNKNIGSPPSSSGGNASDLLSLSSKAVEVDGGPDLVVDIGAPVHASTSSIPSPPSKINAVSASALTPAPSLAPPRPVKQEFTIASPIRKRPPGKTHLRRITPTCLGPLSFKESFVMMNFK